MSRFNCQNNQINSRCRSFLYTAVMAAVPLLVSLQDARAGSCALVTPGVYTCSGAAGADVSQYLSGAPLDVTTEAGFGITVTAAPYAFVLTGTSGLTFLDAHGSTITGGTGIVASNSGGGALSITSTGTITGTGGNGISAGNSSVSSGDLIINAVNVTGYYTGIAASNNGSGVLSITSTGTITGTSSFSAGISADNYSVSGDLTINAVNVSGSSGILAYSNGGGAMSVTTTGTVTATNGAGIVAELSFFDFSSVPPTLGNPANPVSVVTGDVFAAGIRAPAVGVLGGGNVDVDTRAGVLGTTGDRSAGVFAMSISPQYVADIRTGTVTTQGTGAYGVAVAALAYSGSGASSAITVSNSGPIRSSGVDGGGIVALSYAEGGNSPPITINADADVTGSGRNAVGIAASSVYGAVTVNVGAGVSVMGGWSADPAERSTEFSAVQAREFFGEVYRIGSNLPAAGIVVFSGDTSGGPAMKVTNNGTVGALNDQAITMGSPQAQLPAPMPSPVPDPPRPPPVPGVLPPVQSLQVDNNSLITGYVTFWRGAPHTVNNAGTFNVRHFADTDGDGSRDTKAVSLSDFGGPDALFNNLATGVVKFSPVANASVTDPRGYYVPTTGVGSLPLEGSFYDLNREGVVQGQFVNLKSFVNSGTIDLRGPAVGNTLLITGGGGGAEPGTGGGGVFISNGGTLLLNTVLNAGIPPGGQSNSYSDMLIVDSTAPGAAGPTRITVTNVGGGGALTPGNGIEVVEVLDKGNSEAGIFTLNGDYQTRDGQQAVVGGAYAYTLNHGGVGTDVADGNWYLRSQMVEAPLVPRYQPGVPVYEVYPQSLLALIGMPTMQQRVGNRYWREPAPTPETVFCKDATQNFRCPVSAEQASYYADGGRATIEDQAIWARIEGTHYDIGSAVATSGADYNANTWKLQSGADFLLRETQSGSKLIGGITVHYGQVSTDVISIYGNGGIDTSGYGFGGTLTWLDQNGFYADGQASFTWFNSDLSSATANRSLIDGNRGFGYALSMEAGRKIDLNATWTLTPQIQLVYANVDFDRFTDPFGAAVSPDTGESLKGRLGLSADWQESWKDAERKTRRAHVYGIGNLYYEFLDATRVNVSGVSFESRPQRLWGGLGVGSSYNWNDDRYSIYGEGSVNTSLDDFGGSYAVSGNVGFRLRW